MIRYLIVLLAAPTFSACDPGFEPVANYGISPFLLQAVDDLKAYDGFSSQGLTEVGKPCQVWLNAADKHLTLRMQLELEDGRSVSIRRHWQPGSDYVVRELYATDFASPQGRYTLGATPRRPHSSSQQWQILMLGLSEGSIRSVSLLDQALSTSLDQQDFSKLIPPLNTCLLDQA